MNLSKIEINRTYSIHFMKFYIFRKMIILLIEKKIQQEITTEQKYIWGHKSGQMKALSYLNSVIERKTDTKSVVLLTLETETNETDQSKYWQLTRTDWSGDKGKKRGDVCATFYCLEIEQIKIKGEIFENLIICSEMKKSTHN